jgi:hypothetical protein
MKLTATIVVSVQAQTLAEAGAKLDGILEHASDRGGVEVERVELETPPGAVPVTIPATAVAAPPPSRVPHPQPHPNGHS